MSPPRQTRPCTHCGVETEVDDGHEGPVFCCHGCALAYAIIQGAGLDAYYRDREATPPRPGAVATAGWDQVPCTVGEDGINTAELRIDGLRCAACVWVTEKVLQDTAGVVEATVSYATGRAELRWDRAATDLDTVLQRVATLGYAPRALHQPRAPDRDLLLRLGVAIFAAANVMMLSAGIYLGWWSGMEAGYLALFQWVSLVLATPVTLWSAAPFFRAAWSGLRCGVLHVDLPISIGVVVLYGHGLLVVLLGPGPWGADAYLDSLTMLVALLLAGRVVDQRGRRRSAEAAIALASRAPRVVRRAVADRVEVVPPEALVPGDLFEVAAGEEVGADGVVREGHGSVQMALLTGESEPVTVVARARVVAGAVLLDGALRVEVLAAGEQTLLARMAQALEQSAGRPAGPTLADRIAPWFTGVTLGAAALTFAGWALWGGVSAAIPPTIAVLVVACPCALALSQPLATAAGIGAAARRGLLFRSGDALRDLATVDVAALDKTGTATGGVPVVVSADDAVLRVAAGVERSSIHPVGRAIVQEAVRRGIAIPQGREVVETAGRGISGVVDGRRWDLRSGGPGVVEVVDLGLIRLRDTLRADAARTVAALRTLGLEVVLLTGDHPSVAETVGHAAGIEEVHGGVTPSDKEDWIVARRAAGRRVLYVGDGLNDGPALAAAHVGLAMGTGAASSVLVADAVVASDQLGPVLAGILAAREAVAVTRSNLRRSLIYNMLAMTGAVAGLVNPLVAAVLMPLSSALVLAGSLSVERRVRAAQTGLNAEVRP